MYEHFEKVVKVKLSVEEWDEIKLSGALGEREREIWHTWGQEINVSSSPLPFFNVA